MLLSSRDTSQTTGDIVSFFFSFPISLSHTIFLPFCLSIGHCCHTGAAAGAHALQAPRELQLNNYANWQITDVAFTDAPGGTPEKKLVTFTHGTGNGDPTNHPPLLEIYYIPGGPIIDANGDPTSTLANACFSNGGTKLATLNALSGDVAGIDYDITYTDTTTTDLKFEFTTKINDNLNNPTIYAETQDNSTPPKTLAVVQFCVKLSLDKSDGTVVNYKEAALEFTASLDGSFRLEKFAEVEAADPEEEGTDLGDFTVSSRLCAVRGTTITGTPTLQTLNQGDYINICVTNDNGEEASITDIRWFSCWAGQKISTNPTSGPAITFPAISGGNNLDTDLVDFECKSDGSGCEISLLLPAEFYPSDQATTVYKAGCNGLVELDLGSQRRVLAEISPGRDLLDTTLAEFNTTFELNPTMDTGSSGAVSLGTISVVMLAVAASAASLF